MKIAIVDTYYPAFLASHYAAQPGLEQRSYAEQLASLLDSSFGTSDYYSRNLEALGCEAVDIVANCLQLQARWAKENGVQYNRYLLRIPTRLHRLAVVGPLLANLPGIADLAVEQIRSMKPDVLYCQDLRFFSPPLMAEARKHVKLTVGQIASPLPPARFLPGFDLILTSFPHFVPRLRAMGIKAEFFRIGFEERVLERIGRVEKDIACSFVGGISRQHSRAFDLLTKMAEQTEMQFFGYGLETLSPSSAIRRRHHGEVWGLDMYRALARSRVTLNRHINVAENYANNMRLYEATGVGAMLLTDQKDNLGELFEVGREVVAYSSPEEAVELVRYYTSHTDEAARIASAGQTRTLAEHTYAKRMKELVPILETHLSRTVVR
jgi:hypothetical protein